MTEADTHLSTAAALYPTKTLLEVHMTTKNATYLDKATAAGYNTELVRKPRNNEAFRVQIPGLPEGTTAPVYDSQLTARSQALFAAREAIEADDLSFSTRKAGPWSIFVLALEPFKNRARRAEVSYSEASGYRVAFFGRYNEHTHDLRVVVQQLHDEMID
jgi:hypothetical protein